MRTAKRLAASTRTAPPRGLIRLLPVVQASKFELVIILKPLGRVQDPDCSPMARVGRSRHRSEDSARPEAIEASQSSLTR
jgi:hypothetical protein